MALYCYVKSKPTYRPKRVHQTRSVPLRAFLSTMLGVAGLFLIIWVAYPIVSFEVISRYKYAHSGSFNDAHPESTIYAAEESVLGTQAQDTTEIDYTKVSNWFPQTPQDKMNLAGRIYYLTIPKLRIFDAHVKISGENLDESLIHYGGTGLPGDYGTTVIFGHSILPQFYNPKSYKAIFSLLPQLDEGDEIFVKYDGLTYRYVVAHQRITTPSDVSVLEQRYDSSYVRLITCVPPGTYWKRLEVTARLEPL